MNVLEDRYRFLIRAYPADYRRQHGDELLGDLLEASPAGARWPTFDQASALIKGGLRTRRGLAGQDLAARWWHLGDLAALALAGYALLIVAGQLRASIGTYRESGYLVPWFAQEVVTATILVLLIGAVLWGQRSVAAGLGAVSAVVAVLMNVYGLPDSADAAEWWALVVIALIYLALLGFNSRPKAPVTRLTRVVGGSVLIVAVFWFFAGQFVLYRLDVRPLYVVIAVLCLAYLVALVDPGLVFVAAALVLPPALAAICGGLLQPQGWQGFDPITVLRLAVVVVSFGFAAVALRAQSRV